MTPENYLRDRHMRRHMTACTHQILSNCRLPIFSKKDYLYILKTLQSQKHTDISCPIKISILQKQNQHHFKTCKLYHEKKTLPRIFFFNNRGVYGIPHIVSIFVGQDRERHRNDMPHIASDSWDTALLYLDKSKGELFVPAHFHIYDP